MGKEQRDVGAQVAGTDDPEEIRAQIEETREALGDTVAALSYKTDVKARTRAKVDDARAAATDRVDQARTAMTEKADDLAAKAQEAMPPAAQQRLADLERRTREHPRRAVMIVGGVFGALLALLRRRGRG